MRTGLAFAIFGLGGLILGLVCFPLMRLLPGGPAARERRAQRMVHVTFRWFVRLASALALFRVTYTGTERLRGAPPALVVANHPTLIDVVLLLACMPQADCVVKQASWRNLFVRGVVKGAGYVSNDDGEGLVEACVQRLRQGRWLVLFPEGTRSPRGRLGPFHRGMARVALRGGADLLPVVITCEPAFLMKGRRWYEVPDRTPRVTIQVGERIRPGLDRREAGGEGAAARALTAEVRLLFPGGSARARGQ